MSDVLDWPVESSANERQGWQPSAMAAAARAIPVRGRVLVVDDNDDLRSTVRIALEEFGYSVHGACNGREALDAIEGFAADVVLLDLHMPVMDGPAFLRTLRSLRDWNVAWTPVVLLTAFAGDGTGLGVPIVVKPFDIHELLDAIARVRRTVN